MRAPRSFLVVLLAMPLVLGAGARAAPDSEAELQALAGRFQEALDAGRWRRVVRVGERILELRPDLAVVPYHVARACSVLGRREPALSHLERAAANGFAGLSSIEGDPELEPLRGDPRFEACLVRVRASRDARFEPWRRDAERRPIHVFVPETAGASAPLLLVLHGSGGRADELSRLYRPAARAMGAVLAAPESGRVDGSGFSWVFRDEAEWMVLHAVERLSREQGIDPARVILAGYSQGANVALEVGLRHPERFLALAPVNGHWDPKIMRVSPAEGRRPRVLLTIGAEDPWADTFREAERALAGAGFEVRLEVLPGVGHALPEELPSRLAAELPGLLR